jgi:hypothetical protein
MRNSLELPLSERCREQQARRQYRRTPSSPIFISDVHLGTRAVRQRLLADFLLHNDCKTLYSRGRHRRRLAPQSGTGSGVLP